MTAEPEMGSHGTCLIAVAGENEQCSRRKVVRAAVLAIMMAIMGYSVRCMQNVDEQYPAAGNLNLKKHNSIIERNHADSDLEEVTSQDAGSSSPTSSYAHLYRPTIRHDREDMSWITAISRLDNVDQPTVDCDAMQSNPRISPTCNCSRTPGSCCARQFVHNHKHGVFVADHLMNSYFPSQKSGVMRMLDVHDVRYDYRSIVMVRNFYDALVSGYLYHKAGYECWLSPRGRPESRPRGHLHEWASKLEDYPPLVQPTEGPKVPPDSAANLSLCEYLAQAGEEDGMRDYVNFAMVNWFPIIYKTYQMRHADCDRTIAICFNDIIDPGSEAYKETVIRMHLHWFPASLGEAVKVLSKEIKSKSSANKLSKIQETLAAHGTTHDVGVRTRLLRLVQYIDYTYWNGTIAAGNEFYGCRGEFED